jgi:hypothetical protein
VVYGIERHDRTDASVLRREGQDRRSPQRVPGGAQPLWVYLLVEKRPLGVRLGFQEGEDLLHRGKPLVKLVDKSRDRDHIAPTGQVLHAAAILLNAIRKSKHRKAVGKADCRIGRSGRGAADPRAGKREERL